MFIGTSLPSPITSLPLFSSTAMMSISSTGASIRSPASSLTVRFPASSTALTAPSVIIASMKIPTK